MPQGDLPGVPRRPALKPGALLSSSFYAGGTGGNTAAAVAAAVGPSGIGRRAAAAGAGPGRGAAGRGGGGGRVGAAGGRATRGGRGQAAVYSDPDEDEPPPKARGRQRRSAPAAPEELEPIVIDSSEEEGEGGERQGQPGGDAAAGPGPSSAAAAAAAAGGNRPNTRARGTRAYPYDKLSVKLAGLKCCFPPGGTKLSVEVVADDLSRLEPGEFLNDTCIDFFIKFIEFHLDEGRQKRFHFFNSFFLKKLQEAAPKKGQGAAGADDRSKGQQDHDRVKKWTKNMDLFSKDYVFVPIHGGLHWSLMLICHPANALHVKNNARAQLRPAEGGTQEDPVGSPCILHFDSLEGSHQPQAIYKALRTYLEHEWMRKAEDESQPDSVPRRWAQEWRRQNPDAAALPRLQFAGESLPGIRIMSRLPKQNNHHDCGLFLLSYIHFFTAGNPRFIVREGTNARDVSAMDLDPEAADDSTFMQPNWFRRVNAGRLRDHLNYHICRLMLDRMPPWTQDDPDDPRREAAERVKDEYERRPMDPNKRYLDPKEYLAWTRQHPNEPDRGGTSDVMSDGDEDVMFTDAPGEAEEAGMERPEAVLQTPARTTRAKARLAAEPGGLSPAAGAGAAAAGPAGGRKGRARNTGKENKAQAGAPADAIDLASPDKGGGTDGEAAAVSDSDVPSPEDPPPDGGSGGGGGSGRTGRAPADAEAGDGDPLNLNLIYGSDGRGGEGEGEGGAEPEAENLASDEDEEVPGQPAGKPQQGAAQAGAEGAAQQAAAGVQAMAAEEEEEEEHEEPGGLPAAAEAAAEAGQVDGDLEMEEAQAGPGPDLMQVDDPVEEVALPPLGRPEAKAPRPPRKANKEKGQPAATESVDLVGDDEDEQDPAAAPAQTGSHAGPSSEARAETEAGPAAGASAAARASRFAAPALAAAAKHRAAFQESEAAAGPADGGVHAPAQRKGNKRLWQQRLARPSTASPPAAGAAEAPAPAQGPGPVASGSAPNEDEGDPETLPPQRKKRAQHDRKHAPPAAAAAAAPAEPPAAGGGHGGPGRRRGATHPDHAAPHAAGAGGGAGRSFASRFAHLEQEVEDDGAEAGGFVREDPHHHHHHHHGGANRTAHHQGTHPAPDLHGGGGSRWRRSGSGGSGPGAGGGAPGSGATHDRLQVLPPGGIRGPAVVPLGRPQHIKFDDQGEAHEAPGAPAAQAGGGSGGGGGGMHISQTGLHQRHSGSAPTAYQPQPSPHVRGGPGAQAATLAGPSSPGQYPSSGLDSEAQDDADANWGYDTSPVTQRPHAPRGQEPVGARPAAPPARPPQHQHPHQQQQPRVPLDAHRHVEPQHDQVQHQTQGAAAQLQQVQHRVQQQALDRARREQEEFQVTRTAAAKQQQQQQEALAQLQQALEQDQHARAAQQQLQARQQQQEHEQQLGALHNHQIHRQQTAHAYHELQAPHAHLHPHHHQQAQVQALLLRAQSQAQAQGQGQLAVTRSARDGRPAQTQALLRGPGAGLALAVRQERAVMDLRDRSPPRPNPARPGSAGGYAPAVEGGSQGYDASPSGSQGHPSQSQGGYSQGSHGQLQYGQGQGSQGLSQGRGGDQAQGRGSQGGSQGSDFRGSPWQLAPAMAAYSLGLPMGGRGNFYLAVGQPTDTHGPRPTMGPSPEYTAGLAAAPRPQFSQVLGTGFAEQDVRPHNSAAAGSAGRPGQRLGGLQMPPMNPAALRPPAGNTAPFMLLRLPEQGQAPGQLSSKAGPRAPPPSPQQPDTNLVLPPQDGSESDAGDDTQPDGPQRGRAKRRRRHGEPQHPPGLEPGPATALLDQPDALSPQDGPAAAAAGSDGAAALPAGAPAHRVSQAGEDLDLRLTQRPDSQPGERLDAGPVWSDAGGHPDAGGGQQAHGLEAWPGPDEVGGDGEDALYGEDGGDGDGGPPGDEDDWVEGEEWQEDPEGWQEYDGEQAWDEQQEEGVEEHGGEDQQEPEQAQQQQEEEVEVEGHEQGPAPAAAPPPPGPQVGAAGSEAGAGAGAEQDASFEFVHAAGPRSGAAGRNPAPAAVAPDAAAKAPAAPGPGARHAGTGSLFAAARAGAAAGAGPSLAAHALPAAAGHGDEAEPEQSEGEAAQRHTTSTAAESSALSISSSDSEGAGEGEGEDQSPHASGHGEDGTAPRRRRGGRTDDAWEPDSEELAEEYEYNDDTSGGVSDEDEGAGRRGGVRHAVRPRTTPARTMPPRQARPKTKAAVHAGAGAAAQPSTGPSGSRPQRAKAAKFGAAAGRGKRGSGEAGGGVGVDRMRQQTLAEAGFGEAAAPSPDVGRGQKKRRSGGQQRGRSSGGSGKRQRPVQHAVAGAAAAPCTGAAARQAAGSKPDLLDLTSE
ncbi:hypothetical protein HYH03_000684 [Edaphochlamys debaryana]|uniref:Ubiquitin-like protease family profile domain-containing protein n=1 Tax=Edaphochlamys debaryana TaxID=47281 RepID=A0A836C7W7_9CHLO|nr:hypothetical protein HYH03_000684 [Edaphochlamys debaryana]|eukprot:KAG2502197.1 hypothetical protein HYH03_000684 [Edaphochlamys debaryana]